MIRLPENPNAGEGERHRAEGPNGIIYYYDVYTGRALTRVVFAGAPYIMRGGGGVTLCQTLSLINGPRQKD